LESTNQENSNRLCIPKSASFEQFLMALIKIAEHVYRYEQTIGINKKTFMLLKVMEESGHLLQILMNTHMIVRFKSFFD